MCSPGAVTAGLTIISYISGRQSQDAQNDAAADGYDSSADAYDYQAILSDEEAAMRDKEADIADEQAAVSERQASNTIVDGWKSVAKFRIEGEQEAAEQRAQLGASGFEVNTGTNVDIQVDSALSIEVDAQTIQYNSRLEAFKFTQEAFDLSLSAYKSRFAAEQARITAEMHRASAAGARDAAGTSRQDRGLFGITIGGIHL